MNESSRVDRDLERILSGKPVEGDSSSEKLAAVMTKVKKAYLAPVDPEVAQRHLAAMVELSRSLAGSSDYAVLAKTPEDDEYAVQRRSTSWNRPGRLLFKLGLSAAAFSVVMGGLALAGVDVPGAVADAVKSVLGDDDDGTSPADVTPAAERQDADEAQPADATGSPDFVQQLLDFLSSDAERGCEFGQTAAGIAGGEGGGSAEACGRAAGAKGSKATGDEASGGRSAGAGSAQGGKATGDEASGGKSTGAGSEQGSPATGDAASEDHKPDDVGSKADEHRPDAAPTDLPDAAP